MCSMRALTSRMASFVLVCSQGASVWFVWYELGGCPSPHLSPHLSPHGLASARAFHAGHP